MALRKITPESSTELYGDMPMSGKAAEKRIYYPSVSFDNKTLPEGKDWKVGETYAVTLELKMKGISQRTGSDGKERGNYDFDIVSIDPDAKLPQSKKDPKRYT
jgi:hypothetical protein